MSCNPPFDAMGINSAVGSLMVGVALLPAPAASIYMATKLSKIATTELLHALQPTHFPALIGDNDALLQPVEPCPYLPKTRSKTRVDPKTILEWILQKANDAPITIIALERTPVSGALGADLTPLQGGSFGDLPFYVAVEREHGLVYDSRFPAPYEASLLKILSRGYSGAAIGGHFHLQENEAKTPHAAEVISYHPRVESLNVCSTAKRLVHRACINYTGEYEDEASTVMYDPSDNPTDNFSETSSERDRLYWLNPYPGHMSANSVGEDYCFQQSTFD